MTSSQTAVSLPHRHVSREAILTALSDSYEHMTNPERLMKALVTAGVRHPDFVGSSFTGPALERDIYSVPQWCRLPERLATRLAKRGWYVDATTAPETIRTLQQADRLHYVDRLVNQDLLKPIILDATKGVRQHLDDWDWDSLGERLLRAGVTHDDFPQGISPLGALERDIDDVRTALGDQRNEVMHYVYALASYGWTVR